MNRLQPVRLSMLVMAGFLVVMAGGAFYFVSGMTRATYVVTDGVRLATMYLDKPHYDMHLQGLIYAVCFLVAGGLLMLLILLPNGRRPGLPYAEAPPQPRRRTEDTGEEAPPQPAPRQAPQPQAAPQPAQAAQPSPLSIEGTEAEAAPPAAEPAPEAPARVSVDEEAAAAVEPAEDLPILEFGDERADLSGDEDVVYGSGRITEDAVWDFVQQYPDSAVKFLYRKSLDNKSLAPTDEDIYRNWETRGMSRAKVREIVLQIMGWQSLPDSFPHEIWRAVRDQIYEMRAR